MPRKQRFKPSRKPKPIPQAEDTATDRVSSNSGNSQARNDNVDSRPSSASRNTGTASEPDTEPPSR
jgi:hypothetical protein